MNSDTQQLTTASKPSLQERENMVVIIGLIFLAFAILIIAAMSKNVGNLQTALMTSFTGIVGGLIGYLGSGRRGNGVATGQVDTINVNNQKAPTETSGE